MAPQASDAASCSSHGHNCCSHFEVFINHRGPDVKKGLATRLNNCLEGHGLRVFLDDPALERGEWITPQIEGAIRTASVHVAIFSPGYAESSWCLDELVMMLDSSTTIIPVFYNVSPSELRWTRGEKGVYAAGLQRFEDKRASDSEPRYNSSTIEKWRNALSNVSYISGFELSAYKG